MKHWMLSLLLCLPAILAGSLSSYGQSNNFWMNQHGNRARLLGGAMIGSATDLSAVYYNPGALALMEKPEILLAGDVVEFRKIKGKNQIGEEGAIDSTRLTMIPSLLAGEVSLKKIRINRLAYSLLTRVNNHAGIRNRIQQSEIQDFPNLVFFANDLDARQSVDETWFGLTYARKLRSNVGLGVTTFVAYRDHEVLLKNTAQGLNDSGQGAVALDARDLYFDHYRLLWKIGLAGEWNRWRLGLSVTTPGIRLFGSGVRRLDRTLISTIPGPGGSPVTQVTTGTQESDSRYHSPLSIGAGCARRFGDTHLHFSTEWFAPVSEYNVLDIDPFVSQSTGEEIDLTPVNELDHVVNFAMGVEHQLNDNFKLYGSFNSDFSGTKDNSNANLNFPAIDLFHFSGGVQFRIGPSEFTLGGTYATGDTGDKERQEGNLLPEEISVSFQRLSLVIGLNLPF